jgi:hypothetical protein
LKAAEAGIPKHPIANTISAKLLGATQQIFRNYRALGRLFEREAGRVERNEIELIHPSKKCEIGRWSLGVNFCAQKARLWQKTQ